MINPEYEIRQYKCTRCGRQWTSLRRMGQRDPWNCPTCRSQQWNKPRVYNIHTNSAKVKREGQKIKRLVSKALEEHKARLEAKYARMKISKVLVKQAAMLEKARRLAGEAAEGTQEKVAKAISDLGLDK
jgi:putative FmdB family regulatory protein